MMMQQMFRHPRHLRTRATAINRPLAFMILVMLLTIVAALVGLLADPSVITGAPAWLKPLKFAVSISIYSATFIWLLGFVQSHRRIAGIVAWVTTVGLLIEMALIVMQVIRGTTSHFNVGTPFDTTVWSVMAVSVVGIWTANLILGIVLLRQRFADPAFGWALRLGIFISFVGMGVAFFMTSPTAAQLTAAKAGNGLPISGAHSVGVADGGPGIPILGWSTVGGDLRVPHFVGLHGLQLLPLFGWLVVRYGKKLEMATRKALIGIAGFGYLGLVGLLTWQALRGQSIIAPDARTLIAAGSLFAAVTTATLITLSRRPRRPAAHLEPTIPSFHM
ncbi:MAG: hypothetical protein ACR2M3_18060 [Thermomicrobiales bacterium]